MGGIVGLLKDIGKQLNVTRPIRSGSLICHCCFFFSFTASQVTGCWLNIGQGGITNLKSTNFSLETRSGRDKITYHKYGSNPQTKYHERYLYILEQEPYKEREHLDKVGEWKKQGQRGTESRDTWPADAPPTLSQHKMRSAPRASGLQSPKFYAFSDMSRCCL
jgi:hypothetical protein